MGKENNKVLMLPTHEKQEHHNDMWGKGLGMKYSNSRSMELNAINKWITNLAW